MAAALYSNEREVSDADDDARARSTWRQQVAGQENSSS